MADDWLESRVTIQNLQGLHARPATAFVVTALGFSADISVVNGPVVVDGKSLLHLLTLAAKKGTELLIRAKGLDAGAAIQALSDLINRKFDEE